jgi:hypothetical protein
MIVNSSRGGGSKDTWVLEDDGHRREGARDGDIGLSHVVPTSMPDLRYGSEWHNQQQQQQQRGGPGRGCERLGEHPPRSEPSGRGGA